MGGGAWILKVDAKKENILVEAEAEATWLQPGMLVRFEANLDQRGVAESPIKELTVFTARKGYGVGVMLDKPGAVQGSGQRNRKLSRAQRLAQARKEKAGADNPTEKDEDADEQPKSNGPSYLIAGQISRLNEDQILVAAGRDQVTATMAEDVKIKVDIMGDYSLAQQGDKIDFTARRVRQGQAIAKRLKITLDTPLQGKRATTVNEKRRRNRPSTPRDRAVDAALK